MFPAPAKVRWSMQYLATRMSKRCWIKQGYPFMLKLVLNNFRMHSGRWRSLKRPGFQTKWCISRTEYESDTSQLRRFDVFMSIRWIEKPLVTPGSAFIPPFFRVLPVNPWNFIEEFLSMNFFSEDKKSTVLHNRTPLTSEPWKLFALQLSYRHDEGFLSAIKYNAKIINIPGSLFISMPWVRIQ